MSAWKQWVDFHRKHHNCTDDEAIAWANWNEKNPPQSGGSRYVPERELKATILGLRHKAVRERFAMQAAAKDVGWPV